MKDDLISRKTAIEEMLKCGEYYNGNDEAKRGVAQCIGVIHELPSAQPEKHTEERAETHACDCIDRQAAIDALADMHCKSDEDGYVWIIRSDAWARIDALPSAQPQRKMGRWIIEPGIGCKCSECDFDIGNDLDFMEYVNFCPNCGADMRGEQDGSD